MNNDKPSKLPKKLPVRDMCRIALFVAIISVCAQIQIPMPLGMPLTLQTFAIMLAGVVLGAKNGTIATVAYVLLGAFGVPVFSAFTGGLGIIFGRTGGFILSFPLLALAAGIGAKKDNKLRLALWLLIGATINFTCGVLMFSAVMSMSLTASFGFAAAPFIPTELVKIALLVAFGRRIKKQLGAYI